VVNLRLDGGSKGAERAQAKDDFYTFRTRHIYQAVALGLKGARVNDFPSIVSQHLRNHRRPQEVFRTRMVSLQGRLSNYEDIDDLVRQQYNLAPRQPVLPALLDGDLISGNDFWFVIIGWRFALPLADAWPRSEMIQAVAAWCRMHLLQDIRQEAQYANVRVLSVVAMEVVSEEMAEELEDSIATLIENLNDESFHLGQLGQLGKVER